MNKGFWARGPVAVDVRFSWQRWYRWFLGSNLAQNRLPNPKPWTQTLP